MDGVVFLASLPDGIGELVSRAADLIGEEVAKLGGQFGDNPVQLHKLLAVKRGELHADNLAVFDNQIGNAGDGEEGDALLQSGVLEAVVQYLAGLQAGGLGTVAAGGRVGVLVVGVGLLVTGVVQVVLVGGVGSLVGAQRGVEAHAVFLQPLDHAGGLFAEIAEGVVGDNALSFLLDVVEHVLDGVLDASTLLNRGAAAGIDDAAGETGCATANGEVESEDASAIVRSLDSCSGTSATETNDDYVEGIVGDEFLLRRQLISS